MPLVNRDPGDEHHVFKASEFPPRPGILSKAAEVVHGPRQEFYGPPAVNHGRTAVLWQAYLDTRSTGPLNAEDVCWLNTLQKMSREMHSKTEDGLVDAAGYVENIALVRERQ